MRIIYVCSYCNKQFEGQKKNKTAFERCQECERQHLDNPAKPGENKDYQYKATVETY